MSSIQLYPSVNPQLTEDFAFQKISRKIDKIQNEPSVLQILNQSKIVKVTETASFDFPNFPEAKKKFQLYYFELTPEFESQRALLNSIIISGKPEGVIMESNPELRNFTLKFYTSNTTTVKNYLKKIFGFLEEEIRFKTILRKIIENQTRSRKEEELLKKELFASK